MEKIIEYLPFIIPILLVELALMVTALVHISKHKKYRFGNRIFWIIICAIPNLLGPILYLTIGKGEE
jgi:hypothetical protein